MRDVPVLVVASLLGAAVGSFLNVCVLRWPRDESVIRPPSRCPGCDSRIAWYDNVPIVSWLFLRGRCRRCGARISLQYPVVELATALLWLSCAVRFGMTGEAVRGALFLTVLLGIGLTDARHYIIPDEFSLGGLALGLALATLPGGISPLSSALGAAAGFVLLWLVAVGGEWLFRRPAMGFGDVKMMAMVGAFLGPAGVLLTIFLGALFGTLIFGPISWKTGKLVPFGIFLALGAAITYAWGAEIVHWYLATLWQG